MKVQLPEELKADVPQTPWGKILSATPVVMAVVATMLAGLSSSEMSRAQYDRSLAAQQQSKAGDQWSFFQAKRLRGSLQQNTLELLQSVAEVHPLDAAAMRALAEQVPASSKTEVLANLDSTPGRQALDFLQKGQIPTVEADPAVEPALKAALDGFENLRTDPEMAALLAKVDDRTLDEALRAARDRVQGFDTATRPINKAIDQLDKLLGGGVTGLTGASPVRDFTVARLRYSSMRYEAEARLNQAIANLYELQVRKSNISAERHHARSQRFFFGMLAAQFGVIVSTFAIAARQRNLLWSLAAAAGLLAVAFAIYVYLYV